MTNFLLLFSRLSRLYNMTKKKKQGVSMENTTENVQHSFHYANIHDEEILPKLKQDCAY
jgi:hypothetical protein